MPTFPGIIGRTTYPNGATFAPTKNPTQHGRGRRNPSALLSTKTHSATILVGLREGEGKRAKTHKPQEVVRAVERARVAQVGSADASFLSQLGLYTHHSGKVVSEPSVRIMIVKVTPDSVETTRQFLVNMVALSESLCADLGQESVILQKQINGVDKGTYSVTAEV